MKRIAVIVGTRPEAVKLAPVIQALEGSKALRPLVISTSQHAQMVGQILTTFGIGIDFDLRVMRKGQTLWDLSARLASKLGAFFDRTAVDAVLVQGDTTTALFGGLCAFYHQIPVGHVEAGLRTGHSYLPFPEEMNRKLLADLATWHFAPTPATVTRLVRENVPRKRIYLTGNTVVDALRWMARRCDDDFARKLVGGNGRLILVTCHRRENLRQMRGVAKALAAVASSHPDCTIVFPVHPNPAVKEAVSPPLRNLNNVVLCKPLSYDKFLSCLKSAYLVLSDSGGVQEEATALGKPVLVLRDQTERPEGVEAGALRLVGTDPERIIRATTRLLRDPAVYRRMSRGSDVFGDGKAARRIVRILERQV